MAKLVTPAMRRLEKKKGRKESGSLWGEAWKRFKRNRTALFGLAVIILLFLVGLLAPFITTYEYQEQNYKKIRQPPSWEHPFGTDHMGRDIYSRCVYGTRWSLPIGVLCVLAGLALGGIPGVLAAYFGGKVDTIVMRVVDVFQAIPATLLSIAIVAVLGNGVLRLKLYE